MHAGEMCTCQVARTLTTHESRCTLWRVFGSMACCVLAKLVLGPPHYHDTFQTCQTWQVGVCMLARCARAKSHAHFTTPECLVHHTTMTPFKRARRGKWAYACWRDVHVPSRTHTHHTRVEMHLVACVWEYGVLFFGQVGAWSTPPHYHDTFQTCQTWRVGVCMLARCARAKSHA